MRRDERPVALAISEFPMLIGAPFSRVCIGRAACRCCFVPRGLVALVYSGGSACIIRKSVYGMLVYLCMVAVRSRKTEKEREMELSREQASGV